MATKKIDTTRRDEIFSILTVKPAYQEEKVPGVFRQIDKDQWAEINRATLPSLPSSPFSASAINEASAGLQGVPVTTAPKFSPFAINKAAEGLQTAQPSGTGVFKQTSYNGKDLLDTPDSELNNSQVIAKYKYAYENYGTLGREKIRNMLESGGSEALQNIAWMRDLGMSSDRERTLSATDREKDEADKVLSQLAVIAYARSAFLKQAADTYSFNLGTVNNPFASEKDKQEERALQDQMVQEQPGAVILGTIGGEAAKYATMSALLNLIPGFVALKEAGTAAGTIKQAVIRLITGRVVDAPVDILNALANPNNEKAEDVLAEIGINQLWGLGFDAAIEAAMKGIPKLIQTVKGGKQLTEADAAAIKALEDLQNSGAVREKPKAVLPDTFAGGSLLSKADADLSPEQIIQKYTYVANNKDAMDPKIYEGLQKQGREALTKIKETAEGASDIAGAVPFKQATAAEVVETVSGIKGETVGDVAPMLTGNGVMPFKSYPQNLDAMAKGDPAVRKVLKQNIEDPLNTGKTNYARAVQTKLKKYAADMERLDILKDKKKRAAVMWYGEKQRQVNGKIVAYTEEQLKKDFPDSWEKIIEASKIDRALYDGYIETVNESRKAIYPQVEKIAYNRLFGYQEKYYANENLLNKLNAALEAAPVTESTGMATQINQLKKTMEEQKKVIVDLTNQIQNGELLAGKRLVPRKDYYHHFLEMEEGLGGLKNIISTPSEIPIELAGVSGVTKPNAKFAGFLQQRMGGAYTEDSVEAMSRYVRAAEYAVNIDPVIAKLRTVANDIRASNAQIPNGEKLVKWMDNFTNDLAGKTNTIDRVVMEHTPRQIMNGVEWINKRVRANAVGGNINSMVAQWFNIPNAVGIIKSPKDLASGVTDYVKALKGDKELKALMNQSGFLTERYLANTISQFDIGALSSARKVTSFMMEVGDRQATEMIWLSAYNQAKRKGVSNLIDYADDIARRSVAGRGIGEVPLFWKSKVMNLAFPFSVEPTNAILLLADKIGKKDAAGIGAIFLTSWMMNNVAEAITGNRIGFDPIDAVIDSVKDSIENEEDPFTATKNLAMRLGGEVLSNIPMADAIVQSAVPDPNLRKKVFGEADPTRYGTGNLGLSAIGTPIAQLISGQDVDLLEPIANIIPPFGGKQLLRTTQGLQDLGAVPSTNLSKGLQTQPFPASYTDSGRIRFSLDTSDPINVGQLLAFGAFSTKEGKEYLNSGISPLSLKRTEDAETLYTSYQIPLPVYLAAYSITKNFEADKNAKGKSISGSRAKKIRDYVYALPDLSLGQKEVLYQSLKD